MAAALRQQCFELLALFAVCWAIGGHAEGDDVALLQLRSSVKETSLEEQAFQAVHQEVDEYAHDLPEYLSLANRALEDYGEKPRHPLKDYRPEEPPKLWSELAPLAEQFASLCRDKARIAVGGDPAHVIAALQIGAQEAVNESAQLVKGLEAMLKQEIRRAQEFVKRGAANGSHWLPQLGLIDNYFRASFEVKFIGQKGLWASIWVSLRFSWLAKDWAEGGTVMKFTPFVWIGWIFGNGHSLWTGLYNWIDTSEGWRQSFPIIGADFLLAEKARNESSEKAKGASILPTKIVLSLAFTDHGPVFGTQESGSNLGISRKFRLNWNINLTTSKFINFNTDFPFWFEGAIKGTYVEFGCGQWFPLSKFCSYVSPLVLLPNWRSDRSPDVEMPRRNAIKVKKGEKE